MSGCASGSKIRGNSGAWVQWIFLGATAESG
jgi:hypothetical protein